LKYLRQDGGAAIFVAENQEYVDKIVPLIDQLPHLRSVIVIDNSAMFSYAHPKLRPYSQIVATDMRPEEERLSALEDMVQRVGCGDAASSGRTRATRAHR